MELSIPSIPEPLPEDPEDVSRALTTAEAMWARGDHSEGIKWVRKAAEAASEAENDARALQLAKAAADLTGMVTRMSRASIDIEELEPISMTEDIPLVRKPPPAPKVTVPPMVPKASPTTKTQSKPPAPLPSKTSQPPPPMGGGGTKKPVSIKPPAPAPVALKEKAPKEEKPKKRNKSRDSIPPEKLVTADTTETAVPNIPKRPEIGNNDPTFVGTIDDIVRPESASSLEWDIDSTQNLTGDDLPHLPGMNDGDRKTEIAMTPGMPNFKSTMQSYPSPAGAKAVPVGAQAAPITASSGGPPASPGVRPGAAVAERHDQAIVTTQAVRVVVWRDANGVHVAPAGTMVSAITVDAVLVGLEPNTDLTAWLTQKGR